MAAAQDSGNKKRRGFTAKDIATKYDNTLSPDNPLKVTPKALTEWLRQGKTPGSSPQLPGPKQSEPKKALVSALKSFACMKQTAGKSQKPSELLNKARAAVAGTPHEKLLASESQKRKLLKSVRTGPDALSSKKGESIDSRRVDSSYIVVSALSFYMMI
jgi:hypothetical protein